uniref:Sulfatase N-terminal domain-containing protein n=1 Tax=Emiliania huxleyi TaxID=2903 RepID=A0A7S3WCV4_EMIHU
MGSNGGARGGRSGRDGRVLPFPPAPPGGTVGYTMSSSTHRWPEEEPPLKEAPNILIVMFDDAGFGQPSAFGGGIATPSLEKLKATGISYNAFHTTAMCSPTRASLLTGRNHHAVGSGQIAELANAWDGYTGLIPKTAATLPEVLRHYGYATAAFGKDHNTPVDSLGSGPFDRTPTGRGFDHFYGFMAGETSQYEPLLWEGNVQIPTPAAVEGGGAYHLTEDLADKAIGWMRRTKALHPSRPFFVWWTPGAVHGPHHVSARWADRYKGAFSGGWDAYQKETVARQKAMGWLPEEAEPSARPEGLPAWESLSKQERAFQERLMEVYAGFLEHTDYQMGRVVGEVEALGLRNDTLIIDIFSDNGASAEGMGGTVAELNAQNGFTSTVDEQLRVLGALGGLAAIGGAKTDNMYHAAWAWAGGAPFRFTKLVASDWGGTRTPMVVSWPGRVMPDRTPRRQFHHVNDVAPTVYELLGISPPEVVDGHAQDPIDGVSFVYTFDDAGAAERKETQYFDIMGSRGVYHKGWLASTFGPRAPWEMGAPDLATWDPTQDAWQLYDTRLDYSLARDLSGQPAHAGRLGAMRALADAEFRANKVLPVGGGLYVLLHPAEVKRTSNTQWRLFPGMVRIPESEAPNVRNGNVRMEADLDTTASSSGVIFALGGYAGGACLFAADGSLYYEYSALLLRRYTFKVGRLPPSSAHVKVGMEMRTPPQRGAPARLLFTVNGVPAKNESGWRLARRRGLPTATTAAVEVGRTVPVVFTANEGFDVGMDLGSPVADYYYGLKPFRFDGKINAIHFESL